MNRVCWLFVVVLCFGFAPRSIAQTEGPANIPLADAAMPGALQPVGPARLWTKANVYSIINGQAEYYFPYGFKLLTTITFAPPGQPDQGYDVEVYEVASPLDAYGVFAGQRGTDSRDLPVGTEGFVGTTQAVFYQGPFFVKARSIQPIRDAETLKAVAKAVSDLLPANAEVPGELSLVDVPGLQPRTTQYSVEGVLGFELFPRGMEAFVTQGDDEFRVVNVFFDDQDDADAALTKFESYLDDAVATYAWHDTDMGRVLAVTEPQYERALMHRVGSHVVGVAGMNVTLDAHVGALGALAKQQAAAGGGGAGGMAPLELALPKPTFTGTPIDTNVPNLQSIEEAIASRELMVPAGLENVAAGKAVTSSAFAPVSGRFEQITDGSKEATASNVVTLDAGPQWIQIDLESPHEVFAIAVWHYHEEARVYFDVIAQLAGDPDFVLDVETIFNNDHDYSAGIGIGEHKEYLESYYGKIIPAEGKTGRYIRLYSNGSTSGGENHYIEVEVYARPAY